MFWMLFSIHIHSLSAFLALKFVRRRWTECRYQPAINLCNVTNRTQSRTKRGKNTHSHRNIKCHKIKIWRAPCWNVYQLYQWFKGFTEICYGFSCDLLYQIMWSFEWFLNYTSQFDLLIAKKKKSKRFEWEKSRCLITMMWWNVWGNWNVNIVNRCQWHCGGSCRWYLLRVSQVAGTMKRKEYLSPL